LVSYSAVATGLSPGTYSVTATENNGCTASRTFTISEPPALYAQAGVSQTACGSSSFTLGATPAVNGGTPPYNYSWSNAGGQTFSVSNPTYFATSSSLWQLTVSDANGCSATGSVSITVNPLPPVPVITFVNDTLVSSVTSDIQWYLNGSPISGATTASFLPQVNGDYTVEVTEPSTGCTSISTVFNYISTTSFFSAAPPNILLSPNPARDQIRIEIPVKGVVVEEFMLTDFGGKILFRKSSMIDGEFVDVSSLPSGCYYVLVRVKGEIRRSKLLLN
jgi:hypothetical protein